MPNIGNEERPMLRKLKLLLGALILTVGSSMKAGLSWAESSSYEIEDLLSSKKVTILAASDVPKKYISATEKWIEIAVNEWVDKGTEIGIEQAFPLIVTMVHRDANAAAEVTQGLCEEIRENNYSEWLCRNHFMADEHANPLVDGVGSISSYRTENGFHFMMVGTARSPRIGEFAQMILHEMFHVYQLAQFTTKSYGVMQGKSGVRTSTNKGKDVPWWTEGTATHISYRAYARHSNVKKSFVREMTACNLGDCEMGRAPMVKEYFRRGMKLNDIGWVDDAHMGYQMGALFVAYLIDKVGEEEIYAFYRNINDLKFEAAFELHFGQPYTDYIDEFEVYLKENNIRRVLYNIM